MKNKNFNERYKNIFLDNLAQYYCYSLSDFISQHYYEKNVFNYHHSLLLFYNFEE